MGEIIRLLILFENVRFNIGDDKYGSMSFHSQAQEKKLNNINLGQGVRSPDTCWDPARTPEKT